MFTKAVVLLASVSAALAVPFITLPVATTTFSGGKSASVKWQDDGKTPSLKDFGPSIISIYAGNAQQQTKLQTVKDNVDVSTVAEVDFTVDATIGPNSPEYFIRIESIGTKDPAQPQYPALAFSAKFTLDSMTGAFSADVLNQIKGQSTAPLAAPAGPTGTAASGSSSSTAAKTTASTTKASTTGSGASASKTASASILNAKAGWAGALLGAFFGITLL